MLLLHCTRYNVQCDEGQLLHYYITDHDLQGRVNDPTNNNQPTCVDFLGEYKPSITTTKKTNISNNIIIVLVNSNN